MAGAPLSSAARNAKTKIRARITAFVNTSLRPKLTVASAPRISAERHVNCRIHVIMVALVNTTQRRDQQPAHVCSRVRLARMRLVKGF